MERKRLLPLGLGAGSILISLLLISLPFFLIGIWEGLKTWQIYQNFKITDGEVISNVLTSSQATDFNDPAASYDSSTYHAVISFQTIDGSIKTFTEGGGSYPAKYDLGEKVSVMYNPDDPSDAMIRSWEMWFPPILFMVIGSLPILGFVIFFLFIPSINMFHRKPIRNN